MVLLRGGRLLDFVRFGHEVSAPVVLLGERCPVLACAFASEDVDVEIGKLAPVHVEVVRPVGVLVGEVGACPVEHGHEVVADALDALLAKVAEALLVDFNLVVAVGTAIFQRFHNGQRLHHAPFHAIRLDVDFEVMNLLTCPYLAEGHVVQGGHDAFHANLFQLGKGDLILLAKPAPCSFHIVYLFFV